ncbi:MAG: cytochrome c [Pseudomonadota bacterium]
MRRSGTISVAMVLAIGLVSAGTASVSYGQEAIVKERLALMKNIGKHFGAIKKAAGAGNSAAVATNAAAISKLSKSITGYFPAGTSPDKVRTRAKPEIWSDWQGFAGAAKNLENLSAKLAQVAKGGNKGAIMAQFGQTGKRGCGGCHSKFRGPKLK